mmetsp:Transcript_6402/g.39963  ORF Transcript_6402/g.39963 Transcript_6402/m.39963 type:complete len:485 (+) Transcript_6402:3622-5076(+)
MMSVEEVEPRDVVNLEDGTLLSFWDEEGRPWACVAAYKGWDLKPVTCARHKSPSKMKFFPELPPECVFAVVREGCRVGFSSVVARGRMLQATKGEGSPHRVNNHNFGPWEEWTLDASWDRLANVRFREKELGFSIRLVSVGCTSLLRQHEKLLSREERSLREQLYCSSKEVETLQTRLQECETLLKQESIAASEKVKEMKDKLESSSAGQDKLSNDLTEAQAQLKKLELQVHELESERVEACRAAEEAEHEMQNIASEMETIREQYEAKYETFKNSSEAQLQVLETERARLSDALEAIARNVENVSPCLSSKKGRASSGMGSPSPKSVVELPRNEGPSDSVDSTWWGSAKKNTFTREPASYGDGDVFPPEPSLSPKVDSDRHSEGVGFLPEVSLQASAENGGYSPRYQEDAKRRSVGYNELIRKRLDMDSHADSLAEGNTTALAGGLVPAQTPSSKEHAHHATSEFLNTEPLTDEELSEIMGMM